MNPEIKRLIERLKGRKDFGNFGSRWLMLDAPDKDCQQAAVILQAIFDPENQPSQFGTVLLSDGQPAMWDERQ